MFMLLSLRVGKRKRRENRGEKSSSGFAGIVRTLDFLNISKSYLFGVSLWIDQILGFGNIYSFV
jgi:hypothetical protein